MFHTPVLHQNVASTFARLSQAVHLFSAQPGIVFQCSSQTQQCVREEVNRTFVVSEQPVAGFARHNHLSTHEKPAFLLSHEEPPTTWGCSRRRCASRASLVSLHFRAIRAASLDASGASSPTVPEALSRKFMWSRAERLQTSTNSSHVLQPTVLIKRLLMCRGRSSADANAPSDD